MSVAPWFARKPGQAFLAKTAFTPRGFSHGGTTALGSGSTALDGVAVNGTIIDREDDTSHPYAGSQLVVSLLGLLAASTGLTIDVTVSVQDSASTVSTAFSDVTFQLSSTDNDGSTIINAVQMLSTDTDFADQTLVADVDLSKMQRFVRVVVTPSWNSTILSTLGVSAVWNFGGPNVMPTA